MEGVNGSAVIVHPTAEVHPDAQLGPNVVIGADCKIGACVRIRNSVLLSGTHIGQGSLISDSIIGWRNKIGKWVRLGDMTCTAEDIQIKDEALLSGVKILPHKAVTGTHQDTILM